MGRLEKIARSIVRAIISGAEKRKRSPIAFILTLISTIFSLYELPFHKHRPHVFEGLRQRHWHLEEDAYEASFRPEDPAKLEDMLVPMGDMGFSGSVSADFPCLCFSCLSSKTANAPRIRPSSPPPIRGIS